MGRVGPRQGGGCGRRHASPAEFNNDRYVFIAPYFAEVNTKITVSMIAGTPSYAASCIARTSSKTRLKSGCGARHMVR
jgi:hypothetical protein